MPYSILICVFCLTFLFNLLAFIVGTLNRSYFSKQVRYFYYFSIFGFVNATVSSILASFSIRTFTYYNVFNMLNFIALVWILVQFSYPAIKKNTLNTLMIFVIIYAVYFYWQSDVHNMNPYFLVRDKLIICLLAIIFLIKLVRKQDVKLLQAPEFWIVTAIFLSSSVNALMESAADYIFIYKKTPLVRFYIVLNTIHICIYHVLISMGFYISKQAGKANATF